MIFFLKMAQVYFPLTFTVHDVRVFLIYRVVLSVVCGDAPDVSMETWKWEAIMAKVSGESKFQLCHI